VRMADADAVMIWGEIKALFVTDSKAGVVMRDDTPGMANKEVVEVDSLPFLHEGRNIGIGVWARESFGARTLLEICGLLGKAPS